METEQVTYYTSTGVFTYNVMSWRGCDSLTLVTRQLVTWHFITCTICHPQLVTRTPCHLPLVTQHFVTCTTCHPYNFSPTRWRTKHTIARLVLYTYAISWLIPFLSEHYLHWYLCWLNRFYYIISSDVANIYVDIDIHVQMKMALGGLVHRLKLCSKIYAANIEINVGN